MRKMIKLLLSFMLILGIFLFTKAADPSASGKFKDIESHWAKAEIEYLISKGVISGYADGTFRPGETVTRAQAAIMIGRSLGLDGTPRNTRFKDVTADVTGSGFIDALYQRDSIVGYTDYIYRPHTPVTRAEMATNLNRTYPLPNKPDGLDRFKDIKDFLTYNDILYISGNGIAEGFADGTFRPEKTITRAEFSVFLTRTLKLTQPE